jgi:hypothetical protein
MGLIDENKPVGQKSRATVPLMQDVRTDRIMQETEFFKLFSDFHCRKRIMQSFT